MQNVDYGAGEGMDGERFTPVKTKTKMTLLGDDEGSDTDFQVHEAEVEANSTEDYESELEMKQPTVKGNTDLPFF